VDTVDGALPVQQTFQRFLANRVLEKVRRAPAGLVPSQLRADEKDLFKKDVKEAFRYLNR